MAPHSSILAERIPWTKEPGGLRPMGHKESDTTEQCSTESCLFLERTHLCVGLLYEIHLCA